MTEIENMGIYEKLSHMQNELLKMPMQKSGKNSFGGFSYYELDDILPPVTLLCERYECTMFFNFPINEEGICNKGELHLVNWKNSEDRLVNVVPFPELASLPKMNNAQVTGTYQTYLKRYLLLNTFNIVEDEVLDATNPQEFSESNSNGSSQPLKIKKDNRPKSLDKVIRKCHEEYSERECDSKLLNQVSLKMLKNKEITQQERKEIFEYLKKKK